MREARRNLEWLGSRDYLKSHDLGLEKMLQLEYIVFITLYFDQESSCNQGYTDQTRLDRTRTKKIENSRDDRKKSSKKVSIQLVILKWTQTINELGVVWFGFQKNVDHTENRLNLRWLSIAVCFVGSAAVICANHRLQMFSIAFVLVGNK